VENWQNGTPTSAARRHTDFFEPNFKSAKVAQFPRRISEDSRTHLAAWETRVSLTPTMPSLPVTVYLYSGCSTCREAGKWLRENNVAFVEKPIRETPPTLDELKRMLAFQNGNLRRLFNSSGLEYRALKLSEKLPAMNETEALTLLSGNGRLVKRPFVLGAKFGLVGFDQPAWAAAFNK